MDLTVSVLDAASLDVVVTNAACGELGRVPVPSTAGGQPSVVTFHSVFAQVTGLCSLDYGVHLEQTPGASVGAALPFQVGLECAGTQCDFALEAGLEVTGAVALSRALDDAMTQQASSPDLLAAVANAAPALSDAAQSLALAVDREFAAQGLTLGSQCHCLWAGVADIPGEIARRVPRGFGAWACSTKPSDDRDSNASLKARRLCFAAGQGAAAALALPGGQTFTASPLTACVPNSPLPEIAILSAGVGVGVRAETQDGGVEAAAEVTAFFEVDGAFVGVPETLIGTAGPAGPGLQESNASWESGYFLAHEIKTSVDVTAEVLELWGARGPIDEAYSKARPWLMAGFLGGAAVVSLAPEDDLYFGEEPVACRDIPPMHW
ncbi:MAG: hypothetical protein AAGM22_04485 [Acidobacteriota bacterium]